jgi:hypothetical protein
VPQRGSLMRFAALLSSQLLDAFFKKIIIRAKGVIEKRRPTDLGVPRWVEPNAGPLGFRLPLSAALDCRSHARLFHGA